MGSLQPFSLLLTTFGVVLVLDAPLYYFHLSLPAANPHALHPWQLQARVKEKKGR